MCVSFSPPPPPPPGVWGIKARRNGYLDWRAVEEVVTVTISIYGLKVSDEMMQPLQRIPLHSVGSVSACEDEGVWYVHP